VRNYGRYHRRPFSEQEVDSQETELRTVIQNDMPLKLATEPKISNKIDSTSKVYMVYQIESDGLKPSGKL